MKLLVILSWLLLGVMWLLLLILPFKRLTLFMGKANEESPHLLDSTIQNKALKVGWAVYTMSRHTPWESKCLVQAMTVQTILRWLRIPGTLYLGVKKGTDGKVDAHAWVRCGEHIVIGNYGEETYIIVACYSV